ncbi:MAG: FAS1-like dehydratase domain-containing protein [Acidimicrobiales bacterium]
MSIERFPVEDGHILMFARAIGDPNPLYTDREAASGSSAGGIVAPPTFVQAGVHFDPDYPLRPREGRDWLGSGAVSGRSGAASGGSGSGSGGIASTLHAEQRFDYHRVLRAGDVLRAESRRGRSWEKQGRRGGMLRFVETVTEFRDESGELVVTATAVGVRTEHVPGERPDQ